MPFDLTKRNWPSLAHVLRQRAADQPNGTAYAFLPDGDSGEVSLTYGELDRQARAIAAVLQSRGASAARVLLLYPPGLDYIAAFFGCLYAGAVAVPLYPPRLNRSVLRIQSVVADAEARFALTKLNSLEALTRRLPSSEHFGTLLWVTTDNVEAGAESAWRQPALDPAALALLQYTSGSTGKPKGVMLTHGNLLHNSAVIAHGFEHTPSSRGVIWLPPYHDMGLIGGIVQPLFVGFPCTLMPPVSVVERPLRWLKTITQTKATVSGGPNFIYDMCVRKVTPAERDSLDLSSWTVAFTGAEPVRKESLDAFAKAFEACGFRREAFYPCYGLAEATLLVSGGTAGESPAMCAVNRDALARSEVVITDTPRESAKWLVGCGRSAPGQELVIVNPATMNRSSANAVGEIWVRGDSVAKGYWHQAKGSDEIFGARIADTGEGPFLRTGDLGFIKDGELYVTGRLKDLIIIRGRNYYPQDIELTVQQSHPAVRQHIGAAFSVEVEGEERLVVVHEVDRHCDDPDAVIKAARHAVAEQHEVQPYAVILAKIASLPKTSSGKIQRYACREGFLNQALDVVRASVLDIRQSFPGESDRQATAAVPSSPAEVEALLRSVLAAIVGVVLDRVDSDLPLTALGVESLVAVEFSNRINQLLGITVPLAWLLDGSTLWAIAERVWLEVNSVGSLSRDTLPAGADSTFGPAPASFAQERIWFLNQMHAQGDAYNLGAAFRLTGRLDLTVLQQGLAKITCRHEALRTSFALCDGRLVQVVSAPAELLIPLHDLSELTDTTRKSECDRLVREEARTPFDLTSGPLFRAALLRVDRDEHLLVVTMHHSVGDGWSLGVLLEELKHLYQCYSVGKEPTLPSLPIQYADFARWQRQEPQRATLDSHLAFWRERLDGIQPTLSLPTDHVRSFPPTFRAGRRGNFLSHTLVASLKSFCRQQGATPFMVMFTALSIVLHKWSRQSDFVVGTVTANRNRPDIAQLIGCFINFLPVRTVLSGNPTARQLLARVQSTLMEAYAHQDAPFEKIVQAVNPDRYQHQNPLYRVAFLMQNFPLAHSARLGDGLEAVFEGLVTTQTALLDLRFIAGEQPAERGLSFECEYAADLFEAKTVDLLIEAFQTTLESIITQPETSLLEFPLPMELEAQAAAARSRDQTVQIAVAATFTSEPIAETLAFWMDELGSPACTAFAPYNQVLQQLLDPTSLLSRNHDGINVLLVRFEDWLRYGQPGEKSSPETAMEQHVAELTSALIAAVERTKAPYIVGVCPSSPAFTAAHGELVARLEATMRLATGGVSGLHLFTTEDLGGLYPVVDYYDPDADALGHIPFTRLFFAALGTMIVRKIHAFRWVPRKVIVLDCDQTLWSGVCAEDGPEGIRVEVPWRKLQAFMVEQHHAGMLICLCSKNHESDVLAVFASRSDLPLQMEHIVSWRINWQIKSDNLKSLASQLRLDLDSFIFVDDNPIECAEMQANCPEVLTLQLPADPGQIPQFLEHVWAFDHAKITAEDRRRTLMYKQNIERDRLSKSMTLTAFISSLGVETEIREMLLDQAARVAQLTQRTNQFNVTTIRRSERDIRRLCQSGELQCVTVRVRDRFGDYGVVGVLLYRPEGNAIVIDTFLLSCRVLGRGVEHQILAWLGGITRQSGLDHVVVPFIPTNKNEPALRFLQSTFAGFERRDDERLHFHIPAEYAAGVTFVTPAGESAIADRNSEELDVASALLNNRDARTGMDHLLVRIAGELRDPADIARQVQAHRVMSRAVARAASVETPYVAPRTPIESAVAAIWADLLGVERIGIHDDFFELGGHSLLAMQILSRVQHDFHVTPSVRTLFTEAFTVEALSKLVAEYQIQDADKRAVAAVAAEIDRLSDEEVRALLARMAELNS